MKLKLTEKASKEVEVYKLLDNSEYKLFCTQELLACERRYKRFGYYVDKSIATRNMIKALRLLPVLNTAEEWARLHVTESLMNRRVKKQNG